MARRPSAQNSDNGADNATDQPVTVIDQETGEVTIHTESGVTAPKGFLMDSLNGYEIVKRVTLPVVSLKEIGAQILCAMVEPIHVGKEITEGKRNLQMKPADVVTVQAPNGEQGTLVVGEVMKRELEEQYPNQGYIGRWLVIKRVDTREVPGGGGRRYGLYAITEVAHASLPAIVGTPARAIAAD